MCRELGDSCRLMRGGISEERSSSQPGEAQSKQRQQHVQRPWGKREPEFWGVHVVYMVRPGGYGWILTVPSPAFLLVPLTRCLTQWFLTRFKNDLDWRVCGFLMGRCQGCC